MDKDAKRVHTSEIEGSSNHPNVSKPDSEKELPHKERDENTGHSTVRSDGSKPSSKEEVYVNSMSDSVRERCIKLIDAVKLEGMTDAEVKLALLELQITILKELVDVDKFQDECRFRNSKDLEKVKLYFTAKERPYNDPLSQVDQEMHFKSEYRHPEMVEKVRNRIEVFLKDENALPYTALLQTAFGGKSRMAHELAKTVPTIYINLGREDRYPSKTEESAMFFEALREQTALRRNETLKRCLLLAIQNLTNFIQKLNSQESDAERLEKVWQAQVSGKTSFLDKGMLESDLQAVEGVWSRLYESLSKEHEKDILKVLLVIDEARFLGPYQFQEGLFYDMMTVLNQLRVTGMFTLFVDTTSDFIDPEEEDTLFVSGPLKDMRVNPPIYTFDTFDVFLNDQIVLTRDIAHKDKLLRMGRPMWYGFRQSEYADVVEMAKRKLGRSKDNMEGVLASMMCLYAIPHHGTVETAKSLLASNMAFPAYIAPSRTLFKAVYRSEPVLLYAAHMVLEDHNFVHLLDLLNTFLLRGEISTGDRGEIMARVLLLKKVTDKHTEVDSSTLRGVNLLKVDDLLKSMGFSIDSAIPPDGKVHFSHWTRINCNLSPHIMLKCFLRGTAIACRDHQRVIDMVIPVFIDTEENQKLIESLNLEYSRLSQSQRLEANIEDVIAKCFSFVAIQIKSNPNSNDAVEKSFFETNTEFFKGFSAHPGIVMHIQMCGREKEDQVSSLSNGHTYIYRESMEAWRLGSDETERMKNLLNYFVGPRPGIDSEESMDELQEYLIHTELFH